MKKTMMVCAIAVSISGCATITRGTTDQVQLQSNPPDARATTSLGQSCNTPCTLQVSRKDEFRVTFSKDGFENQQVDVKTQVAGSGAAGFAGNVVFGGVVGMGTDAATGATLEHVPNPVRVDLIPVQALPPVVRQQTKPKPKPKPASKPVS